VCSELCSLPPQTLIPSNHSSMSVLLRTFSLGWVALGSYLTTTPYEFNSAPIVLTATSWAAICPALTLLQTSRCVPSPMLCPHIHLAGKSSINLSEKWRRLGPRRAFLVVSSQEWRRLFACAFIHFVRVHLKHALLKRTDNRLTSVAPVNDLLSDTATAQTCAFQGSQILPVI